MMWAWFVYAKYYFESANVRKILRFLCNPKLITVLIRAHHKFPS